MSEVNSKLQEKEDTKSMQTLKKSEIKSIS